MPRRNNSRGSRQQSKGKGNSPKNRHRLGTNTGMSSPELGIRTGFRRATPNLYSANNSQSPNSSKKSHKSHPNIARVPQIMYRSARPGYFDLPDTDPEVFFNYVKFFATSAKFGQFLVRKSEDFETTKKQMEDIVPSLPSSIIFAAKSVYVRTIGTQHRLYAQPTDESKDELHSVIEHAAHSLGSTRPQPKINSLLLGISTLEANAVHHMHIAEDYLINGSGVIHFLNPRVKTMQTR